MPDWAWVLVVGAVIPALTIMLAFKSKHEDDKIGWTMVTVVAVLLLALVAVVTADRSSHHDPCGTAVVVGKYHEHHYVNKHDEDFYHLILQQHGDGDPQDVVTTFAAWRAVENGAEWDLGKCHRRGAL